jgi:streptogramin lyase
LSKKVELTFLKTKAMKTPSRKTIKTLILASLFLASGSILFAGNGSEKTTGNSSNSAVSRAAALTPEQAVQYLAKAGQSGVTVAPANDGTGNFIGTRLDGTRVLVLVSGNSFNGLEDLPN